MLHDEIDGRSAFPASETFVDPFGRRDIEGGGLFIMKRTEAKEVGSPSFEGNELTDNLCNLSGVEYSLDGGLVDHASKCTQKTKNGNGETRKGNDETGKRRRGKGRGDMERGMTEGLGRLG